MNYISWQNKKIKKITCNKPFTIMKNVKKNVKEMVKTFLILILKLNVQFKQRIVIFKCKKIRKLLTYYKLNYKQFKLKTQQICLKYLEFINHSHKLIKILNLQTNQLNIIKTVLIYWKMIRHQNNLGRFKKTQDIYLIYSAFHNIKKKTIEKQLLVFKKVSIFTQR